jgi:hypothetical protein
MKNTNRKGDIAELAVAKKFLELGYWVSIPFGDDAPYDLIVDFDGDFKRIQVKHLKPMKDVLRFKLISECGRKYKDTVDLIIGYNSENGLMYKINPNEFDCDVAVSLKLNIPKNNQTKGVHLAVNYLI